MSTNPYSERLVQLPAYNRFNPKVPGFLAEVTLDPDERVVASIKCYHGQGRLGHLTITTRRLRWFQRLMVRRHDHWPPGTPMVLARTVPPIIELVSGELFQSRAVSPRLFKEFVGLHHEIVEAMRWELTHPAPAGDQLDVLCTSDAHIDWRQQQHPSRR